MRAQRSPQYVSELNRQKTGTVDGRPIGRVRVRRRVIVWCDSNFAEMFGYSRDELVGAPTRILHPSDQAYTAFGRDAFPVIARGEIYRTEIQQRRKNGTLGWYDVSVNLLSPDGDEQVGAFIDTSGRRESWIALLGAEEHYRSLFAAMAEGVVVHSPNGEVIAANPAAESILGLTRSQILGTTPLDPQWRCIREDGTPFPGEQHPARVTLRTGLPLRNQPMGVQLPGAEPRWISVNSRPLYDPESSEPSAVIATFSDITAERRLNQNLRKARADLRAILDHMPGMIGYWNRELRCEFANRAYLEYFGLPPERVVGLYMAEVLGRKLFDLNEPHARLALQGQPQRFERRLLKIDGSLSCTDVRYVPDVEDSGVVRGFYVLSTDITELRESYAQVRALAQRLEVVREDERRSIARSLHEGIAQDLFAAKLTLEHLKARASEGDVQGWTDLGDAIDSCMRSARELADEVRPAALVHLALAEAIAEHANRVRLRSGLAIEVVESTPLPFLDEASRLVFFRAAQEALTNVVRQARASTVQISLGADGGSVKMVVVDDGRGVEEQALSKPASPGLLGLRERFEALGGGLALTRDSLGGTRLVAHLPSMLPGTGRRTP